MANVPPNSFATKPPAYYRKAMECFLKEKDLNFSPSSLLTITMHRPRAPSDVRFDINFDQMQYDKFFFDLLNWIDRYVYGSRHHRMARSEKFKFIYIIETRTTHGSATMPHVHMLTGMDCNLRDKIRDDLPAFYEKIGKLCRHYGFKGDIQFDNHCSEQSSYILKSAWDDILSYRTHEDRRQIGAKEP